MEYGLLKIVPEKRELFVDGTPTALGSRAYEIAALLVEAKGKLVSKDEIMRRVWPATFVEENNIQVAVSALRKALGKHADVVRTVAGRGYQLAVISASTNVPAKTRTLVGREGVVEELERLLGAHPIVTLTGAGGMGKTCLALETARRQLARFPDGVWLVELASITDSKTVPNAVASALEMEGSEDLADPKRVASLMGSRRLLLVLDNCEHVIDSVAKLVNTLVSSNPELRVLTTSREPLRSAAEVLYRLAPLSVPPNDEELDRLLGYGSVQLFIARTRAMAIDLALDGPSMVAIATICRRLDGIPLAIELAASRAATLGIVELSKLLDDQFRLLTSGFRTALPRHRTLRATFDWSYDLLTDAERRGLRHLAIPVGRITLNRAKALLADNGEHAGSAEETIADLVEKSLVVAEPVRGDTRYRLLATTRSYALGKLRDSGEFDKVARQHAQYCLEMNRAAESGWRRRVRLDLLGSLDGMEPIANARAAIDWAFSKTGDAGLGMYLTIAIIPLMMRFSMVAESRQYMARALEVFAVNSQLDRDLEMSLLTAHGMVLLPTMIAGPEPRRSFERALEIAEQSGNMDYQVRNLWGLCSVCLNEGDFRAAKGVVERFHKLAAAWGDPGAMAWADLLLAEVRMVLGDFSSARHHVERTLEQFDQFDLDTEQPSSYRFNFNARVLALGLCGSVLWQQGYSDEAKRKLEESVAEAASNEHVLSLPNLLANWGCVLMLDRGDLSEAERYASMVVDHASRYGLDFWLQWARCFKAALVSKQGRLKEGLEMFRASFAELAGVDHHPRFTRLRATYADALCEAGQTAEALAIAETTLESAERWGHLWMIPEVLRIKGCTLARQPGVEKHLEADRVLKRAFGLASQQGSLSNQLRIAMSLVRLWRTKDQAEEALATLRDTYGQFREGFETTDLKEAQGLLKSG